MKFLPQDFRVSLVPLLILSQVDQMFFCTFTSFHPAQEGYYSIYSKKLYPQKTPNSIGICMKMCVEEVPECACISVHNRSGQFHCYFWGAAQQPTYYTWYSDEHIYRLNRSTTNDSCPLAESLFPAS
ncbi:hypothetical protein V3C99_011404 [Haemonchus contortus]|uniref:Apple domain-containing protein n=1 Tax=Haemonchus contortus TaxID=6289 RepID=A0A7I4Y5K9_HAECO